MWDPNQAENSRISLTNNLRGVFDKYSSADVSPTSTNLNPKRDIDKLSIKALEDVEFEIYKSYKQRVDQLRSQLPEETNNPPDILEGSFGIGNGNTEDNYLQNLVTIIEQSFGADPFLDAGPGFNICELDNSSLNTPNNLQLNDKTIQSLVDSIANIENQSLPSQEWTSQANMSSECWKAELWILKLLLSLLSALNTILSLIRNYFSLIVPIIELVVLIASVWLMPQNITKIANRIGSMAISTAMSLMMTLIASLFQSLNLDCLLSGPSDVMNQLGTIMSGGISTKAKAESFASFADKEQANINKGLQNAKQALNELKSEWENYDFNSEELKANLTKSFTNASTKTININAKGFGAESNIAVTVSPDEVSTDVQVSRRNLDLAAEKFKGGVEVF